MNFEEVLFRAQMGDQEAILQILEMFRPLLIKNSLINGRFDEDLYQELRIAYGASQRPVLRSKTAEMRS